MGSREPGAALSFHDFMERMKNPGFADLVKAIRTFVVTLSSSPPDPDKDSARVQSFIQSTEQLFRSHPLFKGSSEAELDSAAEGLEKYLLTKLFARTFNGSPEDQQRDELLTSKIAALQSFINPQHLDIPPDAVDEGALLLPQKELQRLGTFKAPRDKLTCIVNCCQVVHNLLLSASLASALAAEEESGSIGASDAFAKPPCADDLLPLLIYVVLKANPPNLHLHLQFIQRYRSASRLVSEPAYFFTHLLSASAFIEGLTASQLNGMGEEEFGRRLREGGYKGPITAEEIKQAAAAAEAAAVTRAAAAAAAAAMEAGAVTEEKEDAGAVASSAGVSGLQGVSAAKSDRVTSDTQSPSDSGTVNDRRRREERSLPAVTGMEHRVRERLGGGASEAGGAGAEGVLSGSAMDGRKVVPTQQQQQVTEEGLTKTPQQLLEQEEVVQELLQLEVNGELRRRFRFLYASLEDLRVGDVGEVLMEYKEVVLQHLALCHALQGATIRRKRRGDGGYEGKELLLGESVSGSIDAALLEGATGGELGNVASLQAGISSSVMDDLLRPRNVSSRQGDEIETTESKETEAEQEAIGSTAEQKQVLESIEELENSLRPVKIEEDLGGVG